jgi:biotin carboxyl carrier protein
MKRQAVVDGQTFEIDVAADLAALSITEVEPGVYSVVAGTQSFEARVTRARVGHTVELLGERFPVEIRDPRQLGQGQGVGVSDGVQILSAPMPGKVIRVLVSAGDAVEEGQGLVVVEAMKMQNEMKAAKAGTVSKVLAAAGATVTAGDPLIEIS